MFGRDAFAGEWTLSREIIDRYGAQSGMMHGRAQFAPVDADTLKYVETGEMQLAQGPVLQATRTYLWRFEGAQIVVRFADGADFHTFAPDAAKVATHHLCGDDLYRVRYEFTRWPAWIATWDVKGPRKEYRSVSRYQR